MSAAFSSDLFLRHSAKDKAVVRPPAERLWADGLEHSRVLVLCLSAQALGAGRHSEAGTFRLRDPLNRKRRFLPLQLAGAPIEGSNRRRQERYAQSSFH